MFNWVLLEDWLFRVTREQKARLVRDGLDCDSNMKLAEATIYKRGRKYVSICIGNSVRYFVRRDDGTGTIYAANSRTTPNFKRSFGDLSTVRDFEWGGFEGVAKPGTPWVMVPTKFGYATAVPK